MFIRVVRFTDVNPERVEERTAAVEESDGPPPGVPATAATNIKMIYDKHQGTAVVLQYFETEEDMRAGGEALSGMDPSDTPGTRASVDMGEVKFEREVSV